MRLLDGAMGTELARRGFELRPPLWGARAIVDAPALVRAVHADYAAAGATTLTTASFGLRPGDAELAAASVDLLRQAVPAAEIAGSIAPADPTLPPGARASHYAALGEALAAGGADVLFSETHTTLRGAHEATAALAAFDRPVWVAVSCGPGGQTLGGDSLEGIRLDADVAFVGCTEHLGLQPALEALSPSHRALGVRPSLGRTTPEGFDPRGASQDDVLESVLRCLQAFTLTHVGGCCGTTPSFIRALHEAIAA